MKFVHSMIRVKNLEETTHFFTKFLGLKVVKKKDYEKGKFTLLFLEAPGGGSQIELTHNWEQDKDYTNGTNFGHLAFVVKDIYELCEKLQNSGIKILRPPRDGKMAFIKTPDGISIELLQDGEPLKIKEPWKSMESFGSW